MNNTRLISDLRAMNWRLCNEAADALEAAQAEIERLNERMIEADASIDRLEKAEREIERLNAVLSGYKADQVEGIKISVKQQAEIERLTTRCKLFDAAYKAKTEAQVLVAAAAKVPLTDEQIEAGRNAIFSTSNPYCPCDSKTMRKAVQWAERHHKIK